MLKAEHDRSSKERSDLKAEKEAQAKKIALLEESVAAKEALLGQLKERLAHTSDLLERVRSGLRAVKMMPFLVLPCIGTVDVGQLGLRPLACRDFV